MGNELYARVADEAFFAAMLHSNVPALTDLLSEDFLLIDVMTGSELTKDGFLAVLESGQLKFLTILPSDVRIRSYEKAAVVTGCNQMTGRFGFEEFAVKSRYTHIYIEQDGRWFLVSVQGTQITGD